MEEITIKEIIAFLTGGGASVGGIAGVILVLLRVIPKLHLERFGATLADLLFDLIGKKARLSESEAIFPTLIKFIEAFTARWMLRCGKEEFCNKTEIK
jgi:hypothetical protein